MPVFVRAGGIVPVRTDNVANDVQNPLDKLTFTVAGGAPGSFTLYEDNGTTTNSRQHATTTFHYTESGWASTNQLGGYEPPISRGQQQRRRQCLDTWVGSR
jgi:alpha-glucosidase (family GH31 glycosyl hydrolase)